MNQRSRPEVMDFADYFHGAGNAKLTAGPRHNNCKEEKEFEHVYAFPVVRGCVCPTIKTPTQITNMPIQRRGGTLSPRRK